MFEQGYASRIDLANQEMGVAQAVQALTQVRKSLDQTKDLIAVLCGKFPSEAIASIDLTQLTISALPQSIPSKLVEQRPDVLAAEENIRAANAQIGVAVANMLPQFSIVAASGGAAAVLDQALQSGNRYWSAGVGINQTVFAGGSLYARKKAAEAGTQAAIAQYQSTVLSAFQNVADTLYAYQNDSIAYASSVDFEKSNLTVYQATRQQFDTGYASEPNLIAAEQGFLQSQLLKFQNLSIYYGDVVSLYQALGGGWQNTSPTH
jgi:NodT family efflux transporter outer membrane factor (OMF) lipoprotein